MERWERIEKWLWPRGERRDAWMLLDSARDRRIFVMLLESDLEYACLYSGALPPELERTAPYLVRLEYEHARTRRFLRQAWGNSWGVFLKCDAPFSLLRRHLRRYLIVRGPRAERLLFRFYDPRVLRIYLPACNSEELRALFGPTQSFFVEDEPAERALDFRFDGTGLLSTAVPLRAGDGLPTPAPESPLPDASPAHGLAVLRAEHLAAFSRAEVRRFEQQVLAHLRQFFAQRCRALGEDGALEAVRYGICRARVHGLTSERDVRQYIDLMVALGRDFDIDAGLPWAARILAKKIRPDAKMQALARAAGQHLRSFESHAR